MIVTELSPRSLDTIEIDADRDAARAWIAARFSALMCAAAEKPRVISASSVCAPCLPHPIAKALP